MKESLIRFREAVANHPLELSENEWYILEHDVETGRNGIVVTFPSPTVGVQAGLTKAEFLAMYPAFEGALPTEPHVISFLEFATLADFEAGTLEKAYVILTESADAEFEGIVGYPISVNQLANDAQIAIPATAANMAKVPEEALRWIPEDTELSYIRYNSDFTRISYEREYRITTFDSAPAVDGIDNELLLQYITDVNAFLGNNAVQMMVKYTVGKDKPKLYFALSYCGECQN